MRRLVVTMLLACSIARSGAGADRSTLTENVASRSDPSQTYTLILPDIDTESPPRPLLLVFDPRGRGTHAAAIFRDGAERHGWIVISANGTRSDAEGDGNARAVAALLGEPGRYRADPRRIYAAGFSGTAMLAAAVAVNTRAIAGVIAVGGRQIPQLQPRAYDFAHFGAAGRFDFNNREMRAIDDALENAGRDHLLVEFDGDHRWFDSELASHAIRWMEVVAMRRGLRSRDMALVDAAWAADLARVESLAGGGEFPAAERTLASMARSFEGLRPAEDVRERLARLAADPRAAAVRSEEEEWDAFELRYQKEVFDPVWRLLREIRKPVRAAAVSRVFRLAELQERAHRPGAEGRAARRLLEAVSAQASFYLPRQLTGRGEHALAAAVLRVATAIHPDRSGTWYELARAEALARNRNGALAALATAVEKGFDDRARVLADDAFASLQEERRFRAILARLP